MTEVRVQRVPKVEKRTLPVFAEIEDVMSRIRTRAYELCSGRGFEEGRALDDWLAAEREICWPATELTERDADYVLSVALAGFEPDEISVTATPRELIVNAKHESAHAEEPAVRSKVRWSGFAGNEVYRRVELPVELDVGAVRASFRNGLLKVAAPKLEMPERAAKRIEISKAA